MSAFVAKSCPEMAVVSEELLQWSKDQEVLGDSLD